MMNHVIQRWMKLGVHNTKPIRLFNPTQHIWIRATRNPKVVTYSEEKSSLKRSSSYNNTTNFCSIEIGLTERGLDDIGDITSIEERLKNNNKKHDKIGSKTPPDSKIINVGDTLLTINWEGHSITAADELYHTVWETISGKTVITSPLSGVLLHHNDEHNNYYNTSTILDEDTVLATMTASFNDITKCLQKGNFMEESKYIELVENTALLNPGKFAE